MFLHVNFMKFFIEIDEIFTIKIYHEIYIINCIHSRTFMSNKLTTDGCVSPGQLSELTHTNLADHLCKIDSDSVTKNN